ncbi:MAG TPA: hypothetical protein VKZ68_07075 [Ohtaekwangia sp.]|nr:hypothetical protein [Ohtaekwangia sp.]
MNAWKNLLAFIILFGSFAGYSQVHEVVTDSTFVEEFENIDDAEPQGIADTLAVETRNADPGVVQSLKEDPDMQYEQPPTIAESLWERFLIWLGRLLNGIFDTAENTSWGRLFLYLLGLAAIVVIVMLIMKVDAFKVFYSGDGASTIKANVFDENIHEIDFDREIQNAVQAGDYRRGIRLIFLYALKILSDKQHIVWEQGKTNHDYVVEIKEGQMRQWLHHLSYYFDYAWYGNFTVSRELFDKVNGIFIGWKEIVK